MTAKKIVPLSIALSPWAFAIVDGAHVHPRLEDGA
jgi:hypothetical protein